MATEMQVEAFQLLMKAWKDAFNEMRAAERVCQQAFEQYKKGNGPGSTPAQVAAAERASEVEARLSKELNELSATMKGGH